MERIDELITIKMGPSGPDYNKERSDLWTVMGHMVLMWGMEETPEREAAIDALYDARVARALDENKGPDIVRGIEMDRQTAHNDPEYICDEVLREGV
jgi:hypothetical protein